MKRTDRDALERCIATMRNSKEPSDRKQIEDKLREESRLDAGTFAAYGCQMNALRLKPWQSPPCWIDFRDIKFIIARGDDGVTGDYAAAKLLQRMLAAKLSRFEPDPVSALKQTNPPRAA